MGSQVAVTKKTKVRKCFSSKIRRCRRPSVTQQGDLIYTSSDTILQIHEPHMHVPERFLKPSHLLTRVF